MIDFTTFVLSIRETALVLLGLAESEHAEPDAANIDEARLQIDLLCMMQEKTKGNLTDDEDRLLRTVLYEVRVAWVQQKEGGDNA
jgi:hypothetical protein